MCVLVRPFFRRTFIVADKQTKDRFPLKAQILDFSGVYDDRRVFSLLSWTLGMQTTPKFAQASLEKPFFVDTIVKLRA